MRSAGGGNVGESRGLLSEERKRILDALSGDNLSGPAISRRTRAESRSNDESLLYPALHSLEAGWTLQASWVADSAGNRRRTYRRRRLLPGLRRRRVEG
jgi:DNA-binding PadR family transcriptional regulator